MLKSNNSNIGEFDVRIVIQQEVRTNDLYNQPTKTSWTTFATVWAILDDKSGSESYKADQLTAARSTLFTIRYLSGLKETMRISYNNRFYDIQYIKSPDRKRTLLVGTNLLDEADEEGGAFVALAFTSGFQV